MFLRSPLLYRQLRLISDESIIKAKEYAKKLQELGPQSYYAEHDANWYFKPHEIPGNDDREIGNYPRTTMDNTPYALRDPTIKWDDPLNRRNFNEPLPYDYEVLAVNSLDPDRQNSLPRYFKTLGISIAVIAAIGWTGNELSKKVSIAPRTDPIKIVVRPEYDPEKVKKAAREKYMARLRPENMRTSF